MSGETEQSVSGWTVDTLMQHLLSRMDDRDELLDERFSTQTKAQEVAFKAAEQAVQTALTSAEKAVGKAELAADKRFESVNEFRQQLADQTATFVTRAEYDAAHRSLADKNDVEAKRNDEATQHLNQRVNDLELRITSRLDMGEGDILGTRRMAGVRRSDVSTIIAGIGAILLAIAIVVSVSLALSHHTTPSPTPVSQAPVTISL